MQKIEVFDFNVHLTLDGTFKDYKRNMPSAFSTWQNTKFFLPIGGNVCGIHGIGNYRPHEFLKLVVSCGRDFIATLPWTFDFTAEINPILKHRAVKILKLHPCSLNKSIFDFDYLKIIETCKVNSLAFGLCTFVGDRNLDQQEIELMRKIVRNCMSQRVSIVFFHAFGLDFSRLWCEFGESEFVYFETSFSVVRYREAFTKPLAKILEGNPKNVIFGSDYPDYSLDEIFAHIPPEVLANERFLKSNAVESFVR